MNSTAPRQFQFNLKNDYNFNYEILINVIHLDNRNVSHMIDIYTAFQEAYFLFLISAKDAWETLCLLWIIINEKTLDIITNEIGINFVLVEFRNEVKIIVVTYK